MFSGLAFGFAIFGTVHAQSIPTPSVPEFTLRLVDLSYDVPAVSPTYTTDPYTGEKTLQDAGHVGYHVDNRSIELSITNQQLSFPNSSYHLYYDVQTKGHFDQRWSELYPSYQGALGPTGSGEITFVSSNAPAESNSEYTVLLYSAVNPPNSAAFYPLNAQVDFQVAAVVGHDSQVYLPPLISIMSGQYYPASAFDAMSDWSSTQTINVNGTYASASPTPTSTPTVPESPTLTILPMFLAMLSIAVILKLRKPSVSVHQN